MTEGDARPSGPSVSGAGSGSGKADSGEAGSRSTGSRSTGSAPVASAQLRQRTVDVLCEAFADDRLTVDEFERRVEAAHGARTIPDLRALIEDLASPAGGAGEGSGKGDGAVDRSGTSRSSKASGDGGGAGTALDRPRERLPADSRDHPLPALASPDEVPERSLVLGILGGSTRTGRWVPARHVRAIGSLGGVKLDFRDAIFSPGVTEVNAFAVLGGVEILVPPGVRIEISGVGFLGGFESKATVAPTDHPDAPVLRITGLALLGGVEVTVRYPAESGRDARRRLKYERKERRRRLKEG